LPPGPAQIRENVVVLLSAPELLLPLGASEPLQPPEPVHPVAFVELHVSVLVPPVPTEIGAAVKLAVGTILTETLAPWLIPPAPLHTSEKLVASVSDPVLLLPLLASIPLQPPEALQEVASVEAQVSVVSSPLLTTVFATLSETLGDGTLLPAPPPPPHEPNTAVTRMPATRVETRTSSHFLVCIARHRPPFPIHRMSSTGSGRRGLT